MNQNFQRKKKILIYPFLGILLLYLCIASGLRAQRIGVSYLLTEQGLSNNDVNCIYQSRTGDIWFGTADGLNRYDAYGFSVFRKENKLSESLLDNRILDIIEDQQNNLVIATGSGVSTFHPLFKSFKSLKYSPYKKTTKAILTGPSKLIESNKNVYVGSNNVGLVECSTTENRQIPLFFETKYVTNYNVLAITADDKGCIWMIIENIGLCRFTSGASRVEVVDSRFKKANDLLSEDINHLLLATDEGVQRLDTKNLRFKNQNFTRTVLSLYKDSKRNIWATTDGNGLYVKRIADGSFVNELEETGQNDILSSLAIKEVWEDRQGRLWCASLRGGVTVLTSEATVFQTVMPRQIANVNNDNWFISAFCEDRHGNLWVGTDGKGLYSWNRTNKEFQLFDIPQITSRNITDLVKDQNGAIWIASWDGGIDRYDFTTKKFTNFRLRDSKSGAYCDDVWSLFIDSKGIIWASTFGTGGLFRWNPTEKDFEMVLEGIGNILTITEDSDGSFWLGTDTKVIHLFKEKMVSTDYTFDYRIRSIHETSQSKLWIGTEGGGLLLFDKRSGVYKTYDEGDGLSNNNVLSIQEDDESNLWLTTFNGLNKFDTKRSVFTVYSVADGLQSNQFSYNASARISSGEIVVGGTKGFNVFDPKLIKEVETDYQARLTEFKINGKELGDSVNRDYIQSFIVGEPIELEIPSDKAFITGIYTALPYFAIDNLEYQTYLKGLDREWMSLGQSRSFSYSKIPPGTYELFVRTSRRNNLWNEVSVMKIVVLPPWYRTNWAIASYFILLVLIIFGTVWFRQQKTRLIYEAKLATLEKEKEREIGEKRMHLFTEILEELKTPLMLILNPLKSLIKSDQGAQSKELEIMERNANRMLLLADQLVQVNSSSSNTHAPVIKKFNFIDPINTAFEAFKSIAEQKRIKYEMDCKNEGLDIFGDPQKIELVLFTLFSSLFKSTGEGESITIRIEDSQNSVQLMLWSSNATIAPGFEPFLEDYVIDKEDEFKSDTDLGLRLAKQFINEHNGQLTVKRFGNQGNFIQVELNKGNWFSESLELIKPIERVDQQKLEVPPEDNLFMLNRKKTVLIIDNNVEFRSYLAQVIRKDFTVLEAEDTQHAQEIMAQNPINIILTEVFLDGQGYELCRKLKEDPASQHIPVIFTSVLGSTENQLYGIEAGAEDYLVKPFDINILLARVHAVFEGRSILQQYFFNQITLIDNQIYISQMHRVFLETCIQIIESNLLNTKFNSKQLAVESNMSYSNLYKKVRMISGLSTSAFIRSIRLRRAAVLLLSTDLNVNEVAFAVGIMDLKYFRTKFKELYGIPPSVYARKYRSSFNSEINTITN